MKTETIKSFITEYLHGLHERTRREKSGTKWGLDWVAYNLGLARFGKPLRLPFMRGGGRDYGKAKVEAEFGIDLAFLSDSGRDLVIFVLKDEPLTNKTWTSNDFDRDLRMAMAPDLKSEGLTQLERVTVILAYNKDDEQNGIELYNRLVSDAPPTLRHNIVLAFTRWNLSELVEQTIQHLLSPSLLPEPFFAQLSYIASQCADFRHGSDPWELQLIPNWRRLLENILEGAERGPSAVPVALIILKQHARNNASFATGWIDLIEWAGIALWNKYVRHQEDALLLYANRFWRDFYIAELESFYRSNLEALATEHSIDQIARDSFIGPIAAAWVAFWHLGRLGLLALQADESTEMESAERDEHRLKLQEVVNWVVLLLNENVAAFRPLLDIQHIETFLLAECFRRTGRLSELRDVIANLQARLFLRRFGRNDLPFLDSNNSLQNVFEQVAAKPADPVILTQSSFFVLALLELCCFLPDSQRDGLIAVIHRRLVLGAADEGDPGEISPLNLMSWLPPVDWVQKIFAGAVEDGEAVVVHRFSNSRDATGQEIFSQMVRVVAEMRKVQQFQLPSEIPLAALVLASLRHASPLPPELWRRHAFPQNDGDRRGRS